MAEFVMPALGADMSAGTLLRWEKKPGDRVERGDIIALVHTDKADVEVEVFAGGVVGRLLVEPGASVPVGTPLALIEEDGALPERPAAPVRAAEPSRVLISPSARQLAEELGVDPAAVTGTGPGGRIQRKDVERAAAGREPAAPPAPPPAAEDRQAAMRRAIAAAMARSKREIPHFYLSTTIDMSSAVRWLAETNERRPVTERLLHGVLLVKAVALALHDFPELNAVWEGERGVPKERVHAGVAIWLRGGGLVAPAIHDADRLPLGELMKALSDLTARARAGSLRSSELSDPTITITSIGERGVESLFGIIFPPQVAIVGFGRLVERPWVVQGNVTPCPLVTATLSADHRVSDGHRASGFLATVDRLLQEPEEL
ncbi:MAG TPA: dihydrolipoamide acetyltransferase family protein [Gaiellaceae bacterium]|nr:dihydrolipoamide acetyltransferase family protein [Gaiellaceae bacterium]